MPIITAIKSSGQAVFLRFPLYRLVVLAASGRHRRRRCGSALNRTKFGMMIRAGVDDRAMLSVAGVNVRLLFVAVFAIGGALAGFSGVIGGSALSVAPGEDVRYLLASLVVVIVGGMGSITGAAIGALLIGLAEQIGLVYFPTYGVVLTFVIMVVTLGAAAAGHSRAMRGRALPIPPRHCRRRRYRRRGIGRADRRPRALRSILVPLVASPFLAFQIGAQSLILGMIALSLMVLAGYGGMVSLAQLAVAGVAGYAVAILGANSTGVLGLGWPWWLYVPAAILIAGVVSALIGMIARAHRRHLHDHDHAGGVDRLLLFRAAELFDVQRPFRISRRRAAGGVRRRLVASRSRSIISASSSRRSSTRRSSMARARPSAAR